MSEQNQKILELEKLGCHTSEVMEVSSPRKGKGKAEFYHVNI
jgi:hypothetical protein